MSLNENIIDSFSAFKSADDRRSYAVTELFEALGAVQGEHHVIMNRNYWDGVQHYGLPGGFMLSSHIPRDVSHIIVPKDHTVKWWSKHIKIEETQEEKCY